MKQYIKSGAKILYNYTMTLILFAVFLYPFMTLSGKYFNSLLPVYSIALFIFIAFLTYTDMKELAIMEKKPQYELDPKPWKGLVMGLIAIVPLAVVEMVLASLRFGNDTAERIRHLIINGFVGPMYFIVRLFNESIVGYIAAILLLPAVAGLGYLLGYHGINIMKKLRKKEQVQTKAFTKSPWNPTLNENKPKKKKKKKASGGQ